MARTVVLDEVRLIVRVPTQLSARRVAILRRAILTPRFAERLRTTARDILVALSGVGEISVRLSVGVTR